MFELSNDEYESLRSQNVTLKRGEHAKYLPFAFTEHGILMLSNVLKSEKAIAVSVRMYADHTEVWLAIEQIKGKINNQDKNMEIVFRYLDELSERIPISPEPGPRKRIGYKPDND